jgi:hypothetical protein
MEILTALLSASKARRSDMISPVAPPSFYPEYQIKFKTKYTRKVPKICKIYKYTTLAIDAHLAKPVKVLKVCLIKSVPHYFNVHVIQVLQNMGIQRN